MSGGDALEPDGSGPSAVSLAGKRTGAVLLMLAVGLACGFSRHGATNFAGYDEWLVVSLTSEGIVSFPYANRPLALVWALPGTLGLPATLAGYLVVHLLYLLGAGAVVFLISRRLGRGDLLLALVSGAAATLWVPLDPHRLNPLNNLMYSGATFATMLALLLFLEWATGRGGSTLLAGILAALLASRSYEGTLGLLVLGAPVLLLPVLRELRRPLWRTLLAWEGPMLGLSALAVLPLAGSPSGSYQTSALRLDASISGVAGRLLQQLRWHLEPLVTTSPAELASWRIVLAVTAFALAGLLLLEATGRPADRLRLGRVALAGLALAVAGWSPMLLTAAIARPARMQGFSAPGVGLALGAGVALVASLVAHRWSRPVAVALGCWIVAAGTARTVALQRAWDEGKSVWPAQSRLLRQLGETAPGLLPSTLVILIDPDRVFPASFPFRHAVEYLYEGRAVGVVPEGYDFLYPTRFEAEGVVDEPWPAIRHPWREPMTRYGYDEVVAVRSFRGRLELLERWPGRLLGARAGRYAPRARIAPGPALERFRILGERK